MPLEIEKKWLVNKINSRLLFSVPLKNRIYIEQTYLKTNSDRTKRIRKVINLKTKETKYYINTKEHIAHGICEENEKEISQILYIYFLKRADPDRETIKKTRYNILYKNNHFELDYIWNRDLWLLELELPDAKSLKEKFEIPSFVISFADVTNNRKFSNNHLAKRLRA